MRIGAILMGLLGVLLIAGGFAMKVSVDQVNNLGLLAERHLLVLSGWFLLVLAAVEGGLARLLSAMREQHKATVRWQQSLDEDRRRTAAKAKEADDEEEQEAARALRNLMPPAGVKPTADAFDAAIEEAASEPPPDDRIACRCPTCGKGFHVPPKFAGSAAKCKQCGDTFRVPSP